MIAEAGLPMFAGSVRRAVAFQKAALGGCLVSEVKDPYDPDVQQHPHDDDHGNLLPPDQAGPPKA